MNRRPKTNQNGAARTNGIDKRKDHTNHKGTSPHDRDGNLANGNGIKPRVGERGRDGTVRFMLNPDREQEEKKVVEEYD